MVDTLSCMSYIWVWPILLLMALLLTLLVLTWLTRWKARYLIRCFWLLLLLLLLPRTAIAIPTTTRITETTNMGTRTDPNPLCNSCSIYIYSIAQRKATNSTPVLQSIHHQIVGTCSTEYQPNQNIRMTYIRNYPNLNSNYEPRVGRTKTLPVASHVAVLQKRWMVLSTQHLRHNIPNLESFTSSTTSSTQTVSDTSFQPLIFPSICVESALMDKPQEQNPLGPLQYLSSLVDKCMESRTELARTRTFKSWTKMDIVKKTWNNLKKTVRSDNWLSTNLVGGQSLCISFECQGVSIWGVLIYKRNCYYAQCQKGSRMIWDEW